MTCKGNGCPHGEEFDAFTYFAKMAEGRGDGDEYRKNAADAYAAEIRCINWHTFYDVAEILCTWASAGFETRRVKKEAGEKE